MSNQSEAKARNEKLTLRIEGSAPVARLQELLCREPELKLEVAMPRIGSPSPRSGSEVMPCSTRRA